MPTPPSRLGRNAFIARFGGVFEHSPWIAEAVFDAGLGPEHDTVQGLHQAMCRAMRAAPEDKKLALIRAHPELADRLGRASHLTAESQGEQRSAGLDQCSEEEYQRFLALNAAYKERFGFPFVMAVRGKSRIEILEAFEIRLRNDPDLERDRALQEIEQIALFRLEDLFAEAG